MDQLQTMQIYVQVVDSGSFTQAAEVLQLHRPTITKAVQQLERVLGVRLLHRTTRKVSVTIEGGEFYQRCRRLLEEVNDTFDSFAGHAVNPTGRLRLDLPVTLAKSVIIPALPDFQKRYPQIEMILGATDQPVDLFNDGVDCAVRLGELKDSSLVARRIGAIPMVTCASPQYLERYGMPQNLEDLEQHRAVNFFTGRERKVVHWAFCVKNTTVTRRLKSGIMTNESEALLACGLAGLGLLQGVRPALQPYLDKGLLVQVLADFPALPKPVSVLYPSRSHLAPKVRVFIDWLTDLLDQQQLTGAIC
ncbi:LysR substrate-binding domain-containing protein [Stutzerimonas kunmingensis]|uniref:LysR substrate-binding domain-containing protein n=1 Tax=Stutzerimonas kunmingensis TaxID=1211807 RepID=UPI0028A8A54B|nr:LysR family transcriptional regulator [Stutzerimonas kunmingensis]